MRTARQLSEISPDLRGASLAIGNFDGVHLGHQAVLRQARAAAPDAPLGVLTFEPHPREVFQPAAPPFRLMNAVARAHRLAKLGVDLLVELPFDEAFRSLTDEAFCRTVLAEGIGAANVTVGADFRYGKGRAGDVQTLARDGTSLGFGVTVAEIESLPGVGEISSTAIREALTEGRPREAAAMLGHWHRIEGPVIHGAKRGRELGYPTANMGLPRLHRPAFGVYAVLVEVLGGPHKGQHQGVASLGIRPMFEGDAPNLETYLFDFSGDLYDAHLSIGLVEFLRPEAKFDGLPALIEQMKRDEAKARTILAAL
ncbi:bifunctional riboflavin kinase/FAD synthetase [Vannielia litorea]|uniref:bifunctional riboflavin kinase/FAD synthetase n=1 Tax=Vannielia litorea TaxID=1217970 RepID=UPI001C97C89E|nr:bifunctional riboflavin kinase/FAD synthetase [Vannielia litorea]MBY6050080.1 bifunctional riboflavin kinase/FAD synthetase [Vannielia litorea]MBY6077494.1 bifunctional riboflavin kinase/FAD synthetase [Vannielia litorea]